MVGVDVADIRRVRDVLARYPRAEERLFTGTERTYCRSFDDPVTHFAGTFAAKEAVVKAMRLGSVLGWARRIEIVRDLRGRPAARVTNSSIKEIVVSISHDADVAVAVALLPSACEPAARNAQKMSDELQEKDTGHGTRSVERRGINNESRPNANLRRFLGQNDSEKELPRPHRALVGVVECVCGSDFP